MTTTANFGWDIGFKGKNPWWEIWDTLWDEVDAHLYFPGFPEDATPVAADFLITAASEKVTIGNLFRNISDGTLTVPSLAFGSEQHLGFYYFPAAPHIMNFVHDGEVFLKFVGEQQSIVFVGSAANNFGYGTIRMNVDELAISVDDTGTAQGNADLQLYTFKNLGLALKQDGAMSPAIGAARVGVREMWSIPPYEFYSLSIRSGYPGSTHGDQPFLDMVPNYSKLDSEAVDGYSVIAANISDDSAVAIIRKNLIWLGIENAKKFEIDTSGNAFLATGFKGDVTFGQLATASVPTVEPIGTTGATTWGYKIVAVGSSGESIASAETAIANGNAILDVTNYNRIRFKTTTGAVSYKIYRTTAGGTPNTTGLIGTISDRPGSYASYWNSLNDTGLVGDATVASATNTTGKVIIDWAMAFAEVVNAPAAVANKAILFAQDNGAGKTQLMVQFPTGAAQQIAIEA